MKNEGHRRVPIKDYAFSVRDNPESAIPVITGDILEEHRQVPKKVRNPISGEIKKVKSENPKWRELKQEFYAISAVLGEDVVNRALRERLSISYKEMGRILRTRHSGYFYVDVFENLARYTRGALSNALTTERSLMAGVDELVKPRARVWKRYEVLDDFLLNHTDRPGRRTPEDTRLEVGLENAAAVMSGILNVIPAVYEIQTGVKADPEELSVTAKNSYSIIANLAMMHIDDFSDINTWLSASRGIGSNPLYVSYDPNKFCLERKREEYSLRVIDTQVPLDFRRSRSSESQIGCPAMVNLNGQSAIQKLWEWHVAKSPIVYKEFLKRQNK